ncbi:uncharacterized protein MEPE_01175 [Melanopsichium pennsylvanicum]|uniref:Uncharacterized protein n=1 Tax=Melanopsichium pennsylvanicum TaxID=63383 RepID=A0AAJ5C3I4_9BASI|nr:uncharacterized protein MEPE_01175 [Melanopsichium pennsylvanicum]
MRRPAPPPPTQDVLDLDYGSADVPAHNEVQRTIGNKDKLAADGVPFSRGTGNEVGSSTEPSSSPTVTRSRKIVAYNDDSFDHPTTTAPIPRPQVVPLNGSHGLEYGEIVDDGSANAVAGPSSLLREHASIAASFGDFDGRTNADTDPLEHPPLPAYPPPALFAHEPHLTSAYDPSAPEFRPSLRPPAPHTLHAEAIPYHPASAPSSSFHYGAVEAYASNPEPGAPCPAYDLPYDPHAPFDSYACGAAPPPSYPYVPYSPYPPTASYTTDHYGDPQYTYPTGYAHPQMGRQQEKKLRKQQKRKEKKLLKAKAVQAVNGAAAALNRSHDVASSEPGWIENGKSQACLIIKELQARGVPPERLTEKGVPLSAIQDCCAQLGTSENDYVNRDGTPAAQTQPTPAGAQHTNPMVTTQAENDLLSKAEQGVALTPLEELRRKVLASRLAKAAAASISDQAPQSSSISSSTTTVFDRTAASGETDALLSQIGETIRSLLRPFQGTAAASEPALPVESMPRQAASASKKRSYRDVDAVDNDSANTMTDLAGHDNLSAPAPSRRQRISYADSFSRKPVAPAGEVDLNAPVPDLSGFSETLATSPSMAVATARRRRPLAADFDAAEYRPQVPRLDRFLDVPSGLNTVIDLSDDEMEEDELEAFGAATGWTEALLDLDPRDVQSLRQQTASEHYDNFCTLNGIEARRRARTPQPASETTEASAATTAALQDSIAAQLAASASTSTGPSTPSREELLRKELEIKQLMRKIQMMEERKSKQQSPIDSPTGSPMPQRYMQATQPSPTREAQLAAPTAPQPVSGPSANFSESVSAQPSTQGPEIVQPQASHGSSNGNAFRLDPALQKQRENLLALLASKRKNAAAVTSSNTTTQPIRVDTPDKTAPASTQEEARTLSIDHPATRLPESRRKENLKTKPDQGRIDHQRRFR